MISAVEDNLVEISKEDVIRKLEFYRDANKKTLTNTDRMFQRALRNLKKYSGSRLIDISDVIKRAGLDEQKRPILAVGRADWKQIAIQSVYKNRESHLAFYEANSRVRAQDNMVVLDRGTFSETPRWNIRADVPMIPIEKRPIDGLSNYWILWEANWQDIPYDPYLLKRVDNSNLFVVIEQWDLTPIERMVMRATR